MAASVAIAARRIPAILPCTDRRAARAASGRAATPTNKYFIEQRRALVSCCTSLSRAVLINRLPPSPVFHPRSSVFGPYPLLATSSASPLAVPAKGSTAPAVSLVGITRRFGHKWALRGIELDVAIGDVVVIQGHNGGGKSTLLRVIATAVAPTGGVGQVFGKDLRREASRIRESCALLGSGNGLYEDLSARENLLFAARMLGVRQAPSRVEEALQQVDLTNEANERVRSYSSGMQRRLALARLLLQEPKLLLLDEPFNTLDAAGAALVNSLIAATRERAGAVIVVLHDAGRLTIPPTANLTMTKGRLA
jgi:heme exporter protein A